MKFQFRFGSSTARSPQPFDPSTVAPPPRSSTRVGPSIPSRRRAVWRRTVATVILGCLCGSLAFAYKKGDTAYAKRAETSLLSEPKALASAIGKAAFAEPLMVTDTRGAWLQVKGAKASGWIFEGNVAAEKPSLAPAAGLTKIDASATNTVAAARPLSEAANAYAGRHSATTARDDIDWLEKEAAKATAEQVTEYLKKNKKGEHRE